MTHVEARQRMSGIEFFRKMLAGEMPPPPMIELLGIRIAEVDEGRVVFTATCEERFYNGTGVAHGVLDVPADRLEHRKRPVDHLENR